MKDNFDCMDCEGICCLNPPQLNSIEEIKRAKDLGAEVVSVEFEPGKFVAVIAQKNKMCPFLEKDGKCSIYDYRFKACREYSCALIGETDQEVFKKLSNPHNAIKMFQSKVISMPNFFSRKEIEDNGVKIMKRSEILEKTVKVNLHDFASKVIQLLSNMINRD